MRSLRYGWYVVTATLIALGASFALHGTALAQSRAAAQQGPPSVMFIAVISAVFVGIVVLFLVFARSQGCDTSQDKKEEWQ